MEKLNPWKFGLVLSLAVGLNYVLCTIFWTIWPEPTIDILNALFHGLDFHKLQTGAPFALPNYCVALVTLIIAMYVLGVVFAMLRNLLQPYGK